MTPAEIHGAARAIASKARALCRDPEPEDEIEALAFRVRREALEEACRMICGGCVQGASLDVGGGYHREPALLLYCRALPIRALLEREAGR